MKGSGDCSLLLIDHTIKGLGKLKIRTRILAGFGFVAFAMLTIIVFSFNNSIKIYDLFEELTKETIPGSIAMRDINSYASQVYLLTKSQIGAEGVEKRRLQEVIYKLEKAGSEHLENMTYLESGNEITAKELLRKIWAVDAAAMEVTGLKEQRAAPEELTARINNVFQPLILKLFDQIEEEKAIYKEKLTAAENTVHGVRIYGFSYGLLASASAVFLAAGIALAVTRSILEPLKSLQYGVGMIGRANLSYKVGTDAKDEIGQLSRAFDQMSEDLKKTTTSNKMLKVIREYANNIEQQLQAVKEKLQYEVTERKRVEENLEISKAEFQDFVHIASHDLRSPLRKISSFGILLQDSLEGKLEDEDKENLEFLIGGAQKMAQMIEDLVMYSRLNTEDLELKSLNLNEIVERLKQLELADLLEQTSAKIEISEAMPKVCADPALAKRLLQNLLFNALRYRKEDRNPRIRIRAQESTRDMVKIEVRDNGIGIDEKNFSRIFKMFMRLHSSQEGTGAGLAICERIVDIHGGRIEVDSQAGAGSTFWFTLPASKSQKREEGTTISSVKIGVGR